MNQESLSLTNFIDLSYEQKLEVLDWRNHDNVRKWMYTHGVIGTEEHFGFIEKLKSDDRKLYFLVSEENALGVIYFTDIDAEQHKAEFGLYAKPDCKGKGSVLMDTICDYGFKVLKLKKLSAEVFEENEKAIALYRNFGFEQVNTKTTGNRKILYMELVNENR